MHEATQLPLGQGNIEVSIETKSETSVSAPDVRFGDLDELAMACFTDKELTEIRDGDSAKISFEFTMTDEPGEEVEKTFDKAIEEAEKKQGKLSKGVYFEVEGLRSIAGEEETEISNFYEDVEIQMDIPRYLIAEGRNYYTMMDSMGNCEIYEDSDHDADSFALDTDNIGTMLLLYQRQEDAVKPIVHTIRVGKEILLGGGIALLIIIWVVIDRFFHEKT